MGVLKEAYAKLKKEQEGQQEFIKQQSTVIADLQHKLDAAYMAAVTPKGHKLDAEDLAVVDAIIEAGGGVLLAEAPLEVPVAASVAATVVTVEAPAT